MMHFVRAFSIYTSLRLIAIKEAQNYEKIVYIKNISKRAGGRRHTPHPTPPPPRSAPGHKLQKPSKESGIFQSHGTIYFVNFLLKDKVKRRGPGRGRGWHNAPLNTLLAVLHLFCDMIIIGKESSIAFSAF